MNCLACGDFFFPRPGKKFCRSACCVDYNRFKKRYLEELHSREQQFLSLSDDEQRELTKSALSTVRNRMGSAAADKVARGPLLREITLSTRDHRLVFLPEAVAEQRTLDDT
jgi:hypothetical protein